MTKSRRNSLGEKNIEQATTALKRGSYLLKYGRRGKPKFCPFQLSSDETALLWYVGKEEKRLILADVSRIIPGQRTEVFQRFPRPEKEYQSFSLIYGKRSLDLICKDKDEAEIWLVALQALISQGNCQKWRGEINGSSKSSSTSVAVTPRISPSNVSSSSEDKSLEGSSHMQTSPHSSKGPPQKRLGRAISDLLLYSSAEFSPQRDLFLYKYKNDANGPSSANTSRLSSSSALSSSTQKSLFEDLDNLSDIFVWGEGAGDGLLGGGQHKTGDQSGARVDANLPKAMESTQLIDVDDIACGSTHAVLVTKQGEVFSWGEGSGGRLGHGVEADSHNPKLVHALCGLSIKSVACGEYHTSALTASGELYTWGGGTYNLGLLGHGNEVSYWTPKKVTGQIGGLHISSVSCGPWHSAAITTTGQLFTFGDGSFGALGHGDRSSTSCPREVETLKGFRTLMVSCGFWHTAAVVDTTNSDGQVEGKLFTWGNGDDGQLGHGDKTSRLIPCCIESLEKASFCKVACGHSITVALTTSGGVYTMGRAEYGQLGSPGNNGRSPACVQGKLKNIFIEEIACGSSHVAALSSSEVYTWGKGKNGQLGHGDFSDRDNPTLIEALKNKKVKAVVCGSNCTIAICLYKRSSLTDSSVCSGCFRPFSFTRKRHNCYHCGLSFCRGCSSKKSLKASLALDGNKSCHVCDGCFCKLKRDSDSCLSILPPNPKASNGSWERSTPEAKAKESFEIRPHSFLSKLASFDSSKGSRQESNKIERRYSIAGNFSPSYSGSSQCDRLCRSSSSKSVLDCSDKVSISLPGSAAHSQPVSPVSERSSPFNLPMVKYSPSSSSYLEATGDNIKQENDDLKNEVSFLREQVNVLTHRSHFLASELERTSGKIQDATQLAKSEADKNSAAKEVIKSLVNQLKDMAARVPPASSCNMKSSDSFLENNYPSIRLSY